MEYKRFYVYEIIGGHIFGLKTKCGLRQSSLSGDEEKKYLVGEFFQDGNSHIEKATVLDVTEIIMSSLEKYGPALFEAGLLHGRNERISTLERRLFVALLGVAFFGFATFVLSVTLIVR
jgi:hypothetical protein